MRHGVTIDQIKQWRPCTVYWDERLRNLFNGREFLTFEDYASLPIPEIDRMWGLDRFWPEVAIPAIIKTIDRCVKEHMLHHRDAQVRELSEYWLSHEYDLYNEKSRKDLKYSIVSVRRIGHDNYAHAIVLTTGAMLFLIDAIHNSKDKWSFADLLGMVKGNVTNAWQENRPREFARIEERRQLQDYIETYKEIKQ